MKGESYFFDIKPCHSHRKDALPSAIVKNAFQQHTEGENSNMSRLSTFTTRALSAQFLKPTLAILAACIVGGAWADWIHWDAGGTDQDFTTKENWHTDICPTGTDDCEFTGDSQGKTVSFSSRVEDVGWLHVRSAFEDKASILPVTWNAVSSSCGFSAKTIGIADLYICTSSLVINRGEYSASDLSYWNWGAKTTTTVDIDGGSLNLNGGLNALFGGDNSNPWQNVGQSSLTVNVKRGVFAVKGNAMYLGTNSISSEGTINVGEEDGSSEAYFEVGTSEAPQSLYVCDWDCDKTTVNINVFANGTVRASNIRKGADASGDSTANLNLKGGTLQALSSSVLVDSTIAMIVSAAGGTIDTNGKAITIASAITGAGTLTITGGGVVTFTTAPTCGLNVENGVAVLPGNSQTGAIEIGAHGALVFDLNGETVTKGSFYTLATNVSTLSIPSGESYNDCIFTIGPDFKGTVSYDDDTDALKVRADTAPSGNTRKVAIPLLSDLWIDGYNNWAVDGVNGATNGTDGNPTPRNYQGVSTRRDIVIFSANTTVRMWDTNHPSNFTVALRGAEVTLLSGATNKSSLELAAVVGSGTVIASDVYLTANGTENIQFSTTGVGTITESSTGVSYTWTGSDTGSWSDISNWSYANDIGASRYPKAGDTITFESAVSVVVDVADAGATLDASCGNNLTLVGGEGAAALEIPAGVKVYADATTPPSVTLKGTEFDGSGEFVYSQYPKTLPAIDSSWTGVVELNGTTDGELKLINFANAKSKLRIGNGGFTAKAAFSAGNGDHNIGELQLGGNLSLERKTQNYYVDYIVIPARLSGSGDIIVNRNSGSSGNQNVRELFTGDISEFRGGINRQYNDGSYPIQMQFITTNSDPVNDENLVECVKNSVAIAAGTTFTLAGGKSIYLRQSGNLLIVNGVLNLNGSITGNIYGGSGKIVLGSYDVSVGSSFAANANWTGVVELPAQTAPGVNTTISKLSGNYYGNANTFVKLDGLAAGDFGYNFPAMVIPKLNLAGNVATKGGSATTIAYITGNGDFTAGTAAHTITKLENYTGTLDTTDGGSIAIEAVYVDTLADENAAIVQTTADCNFIGSAALYVGGEATGKRLTKKATGGLYIDAGVATDSNGTPYDAVALAVQAANASDEITGVTVNLDASEALTISKALTLTLNNSAVLEATSLAIENDAALTLAGSGTFVVPKGTAFASLTIGDGVTIKVSGSGVVTDAVLFSYTSGGFTTAPVTINTVLGNIHYTVVTADGITSITAGKKFFWRGANGANLKTNNWLEYGDSEVGSEMPGIADTAIFDAATKDRIAYISMNETYNFNIDVQENISLVYGSGSNANCYIGTLAGESTIETWLSVAENKTATLRTTSNIGIGQGLRIRSTLKGKGTVSLTRNGSNRYTYIEGDTSKFEGTVDISLNGTSNDLQGSLINAAISTDNRLSKWYISRNGAAIYRTGDNSANYTPFLFDGTYKFGVLQAWIAPTSNDITRSIEIGEEIDDDSWVRGKWYSEPRSTITWKAETATLTLGITNTASLVVANTGRVKILDADSTPSSVSFTGAGYLVLDSDNASAADAIVNAINTSTAVVGFDVAMVDVNLDDEDDGVTAAVTDWSALAASGITKKGNGTLTLTGTPPTYTGTTTVEAGVLVIGGAFNTSSTAIAPGATLKVLTPSGTTPTVSGGGLYEVAVATDGDYTVYTVVASAESIAVNGAPANIVVDVDDMASVGITAGMTDAQKSAALEATAGNGLAVWQNYVMNIEGNATQKFAAVVTPTTDATMTVATSFGEVAGRTGAGVTVSYKLMKKSGETWVQVGEASTTPSFSVNPSTLDSNARLKIQAVFAE